MFGLTKAALAVAVLASSAVGQTTFYEQPDQVWAQVFAAMEDNNGIVVSPDDSIVFATSSTGGVAAMKRDDGTILWDSTAEGGFSNGEVTFSSDGETIYYPVSTGETW
jgi:outer membrane protein assembly factor BamB